MKVLRLPEGSRTRKLGVRVDGVLVSAEFNKKGTAKVNDADAKTLCDAFSALTLVTDKKAKESQKTSDENTEEE